MQYKRRFGLVDSLVASPPAPSSLLAYRQAVAVKPTAP